MILPFVGGLVIFFAVGLLEINNIGVWKQLSGNSELKKKAMKTDIKKAELFSKVTK